MMQPQAAGTPHGQRSSATGSRHASTVPSR